MEHENHKENFPSSRWHKSPRGPDLYGFYFSSNYVDLVLSSSSSFDFPSISLFSHNQLRVAADHHQSKSPKNISHTNL